MSAGRMERVKTALRTRAEICAMSDLYGDALANGRNDISTLSLHGWLIESWWVSHGETPGHKHYRLTSEPDAEQSTFQRRMRLVGHFSRGQR